MQSSATQIEKPIKNYKLDNIFYGLYKVAYSKTDSIIDLLLGSKPERPDGRQAENPKFPFGWPASAGMHRLNTKSSETTDRLGWFGSAATAEHQMHEKH